MQNEKERPLDLLREWYEWWQANGPSKLPDSLHVRTALAIALNDFELQNCPHDYWKFELGGKTSCRACGADTSDMEAMGG